MSDSQDNFDQASQYSVAPDFRFDSPLPLPRNPDLIPTNQEINQSLSEINKKFPQVPLDKLVSLLYNNLITPKLPPDLQPSPIKLPKLQAIQDPQNQQNLRKAQGWETDSLKEHTLSYGANGFACREEEVRYQEKRLVGQGYCEKGYGLNKLKEHVWQTTQSVLKMDKRRYKRVCANVLAESYRRLQQFLIEDCSRNIKPLSMQEMRALFAILSNAQTKFEEDQFLTFRKFVRVCFDLGSVSIFQQAAVRLYIRIQISLRGRVGAMKLDRQQQAEFKPKKQLLRSPGRYQNQRAQSQTIWTAQLEADLVETIAEQRTIARTRDVLRLKYGQNVVLNSVKELKGRFFKIIRISVKRLAKYAQDYAHKVPLLVPVSDQKIKVIIRSPDAVQARIALGKLYKTKTPSAEQLTQVINLVNKFCYEEQTRREQGEILREPIISSVTDKIRHNITVSRKILKNVTTPAQRVSKDSQLVFLKDSLQNYQHIVSLQHEDKLHYFRKVGVINNKGGFQYEGKPPQLKRLELEQGDDDSERMVEVSVEDDDESDRD